MLKSSNKVEYIQGNNIFIVSIFIISISFLLSYGTIVGYSFLLYLSYIVLASYLLFIFKREYLFYFVVCYFLFTILFHLPDNLKIVDMDYATYIEMIIMIFALKIVMKRNVNVLSDKIFLLILLYSIIGVFSIIVNNRPIVSIILFLKTPIVLYCIYLVFYKYATFSFLKKIYPFIISYWLAQPFIIVLQNNLLLDKLYFYQGSFFDFFGGSMGWGSTQQISVSASLMWLFLISNPKIDKSIKILATVTFPLISIFASAGGGLIIILITVVTYFLLQGNLKKIYSILGISIVIIVFYFIVPKIITVEHRGFRYYSTLVKGDYQSIINDQITNETGRIYMLDYLAKRLNNEASILVGAGPFSVSGSKYFKSSTLFYYNRILSDIQKEFGELGILGYLSILFVYIYPIMKLKANKINKYLSIFIIILGSIYGHILSSIFFAINFWILLDLYEGVNSGSLDYSF